MDNKFEKFQDCHPCETPEHLSTTAMEPPNQHTAMSCVATALRGKNIAGVPMCSCLTSTRADDKMDGFRRWYIEAENNTTSTTDGQ